MSRQLSSWSPGAPTAKAGSLHRAGFRVFSGVSRHGQETRIPLLRFHAPLTSRPYLFFLSLFFCLSLCFAATVPWNRRIGSAAEHGCSVASTASDDCGWILDTSGRGVALLEPSKQHDRTSQDAVPFDHLLPVFAATLPARADTVGAFPTLVRGDESLVEPDPPTAMSVLESESVTQAITTRR
jgi:hypothetical protein